MRDDTGPMRADVLAAAGAGPELLYVPGIDGSGELLLGTAARLERDYRLTRVHYVGGSEGDYASLAASIAALIESSAGGRALVLAESFGVALALQLVLDHPERVAGLALVNGFAHYHDRLGLALTRGIFALAPQAWIRRARGGFVQRGLFSPRRDEEALQTLLSLRGDWFGPGYRGRLRMIHALDLRPRLHEIRRPVELFAADQDKVVASVPAAREMKALLSNAELTVIEQAGHMVLPLRAEPWEERMGRLARRAADLR